MKIFKLDFIYIGGPRSANTWMSRCLGDHPDIIVPHKQEVSPFDDKGNMYYEDFKKIFLNSRGHEKKGVFPVFFMASSINGEHLKRYYPDIKILACLRNPVTRAHSGWFHNVTRGRYGDISFDEAVRKYQELLEPGFFYKHLKPYFENFPKENIFVMIYEDIKKDNQKFIKRMYEFLEVDANFVSPRLKERPNPSTGRRVRSLLLQEIVFKFFQIIKKVKKNEAGKAFVNLAKKLRAQEIIFLLNRKNLIPAEKRKPTKRPPIKGETKKYLLEIYKDDIASLEKLIDKDLSHWKL